MENLNYIDINENLFLEEMKKIVSNNPNTNQIRCAQEKLKQYSKNIISLEIYLNLLNSNDDENKNEKNLNTKIKQLTAILFNRKLERHWVKLNNNTKKNLENKILEVFKKESNFLVMRSIGEIIYKIIKLNFIGNEENKILFQEILRDPFTYNAMEINIFEINLLILSELIENNFNYLNKFMPNVYNILNEAIKNGSNKMKENASKCFGNILKNFKSNNNNNKDNNNNINIIKELIPFFLLQMKNFNEDVIKNIYENLCDLNEDSFKLLDPFAEDFINLTFYFLINSEFSNNSKLIISEFLIIFSEFNRNLFKKNGNLLIKKFLELAFKYASEPEVKINDNNNKDYDNDNDNDYPLFDIGERIIESFSILFPPKIIFPICIEITKNFISSQNIHKIKSAIISFGLIAEGCSDLLKKNLSDIIDLIVGKFVEYNSINSTNESHKKIINTACIISVDRLGEFCYPNILDYQDKIIPMIMYGLSDLNIQNNNEDLLHKTIICLNFLCKNNEFDIGNYLEKILPNLIYLINSKNQMIQRDSINVLSSILENTKNLKPEILHKILEACKFLISNKLSIEDNSLRALALECVSHISFSLKMINFSDYFLYFSHFAIECIQSNIYEFQDAGFTFIGSLANNLGPSAIANDLDKIMPIIFKSLKDESGKNNNIEDEVNLDSDSEDEIEENGISKII
jgi:hypothetical protein